MCWGLDACEQCLRTCVVKERSFAAQLGDDDVMLAVRQYDTVSMSLAATELAGGREGCAGSWQKGRGEHKQLRLAAAKSSWAGTGATSLTFTRLSRKLTAFCTLDSLPSSNPVCTLPQNIASIPTLTRLSRKLTAFCTLDSLSAHSRNIASKACGGGRGWFP